MKKMRNVLIAISLTALFFLARALPAAQRPAADINTATGDRAHAISVLISSTGVIRSLSAYEYIAGVCASYCTPSSSAAACQTVAVLARTFLAESRSSFRHAFADVCDNPACCLGLVLQTQSEKRRQTLNSIYATNAFLSALKIQNAIASTEGLILTYSGQAVHVFFFPSSWGLTENASEVFSEPLPYLRSVSSSEDRELHKKELTITMDEFFSTFNAYYGSEAVTWADFLDTHSVSRRSSGAVDYLSAGTRTFTSAEFCSLFGIPSAFFDMTVYRDRIVIVSWGEGSGLGVSLAGAEAMAKSGSSYRDILMHYYQGCLIERDPSY